jgi:ketosteroid isomerase-like protein
MESGTGSETGGPSGTGKGQGVAMDDVEAFLSTVVPQLRDEVVAVHNGDVGPRMALWSRNEPVTLFGAERTARGWRELEPVFEWLASSFSGSQSCEYEVLAAEASGDLGYIVGIEHSVATRGGREPESYALRVTTVLRREDGAWKVVHRHGDRYDPSTGEIVARQAEPAAATAGGAATDASTAGR